MDYPKTLKLVQDGRTDEFINLLHSSKDVATFINQRHKKSGDNSAIVAARFGRLDILEILHRNGMDLDQRNDDGKRALHEAAYSSQLECVRFLIKVGVEIDCLKRADWTPLLLACTKPHLPIINILIRSGASLSQCNKDGWDCFHIAAREGHVDILEYLLNELKTAGLWSSEKKSKNGRTALHTAALHGKTAAVRFIIDNCGYSPDTPDSCGSTPLMDALRSGHIDAADLLVKYHQASIHAYDKLGNQPVHVASQAGCVPSLDYLIVKHQVDPQVKSKGNLMTPLHFAAKESHIHVISYLVQFGIDVDAQDIKGRTALHLSSAAGYEDCVTSLLRDHKANSSLRDSNGMTALDFAIKPSVKKILQNPST